jgi:diguanylate cyclase (GGDEF)-like protein
VPLEQVIGQTTPNFYVDPTVRPRLLQILSTEGYYDGEEVQLQTSDGRMFWALMSGRVTEYEGHTCVLTGVLDVTNQKLLEEQLRDQASTDPLTGVANRRTFMEAGEQEIRRNDRTGQPLSLCCLDADHFKQINDRYGHAVGDEVLVEIAKAAQAELRAVDLLARVGGEEFSILLPETNAAGAAAMAERIRVRTRQLELRGGAITATISLGIAQRTPGETLDQLLARADRALYASKQAGRDRVSLG